MRHHAHRSAPSSLPAVAALALTFALAGCQSGGDGGGGSAGSGGGPRAGSGGSSPGGSGGAAPGGSSGGGASGGAGGSAPGGSSGAAPGGSGGQSDSGGSGGTPSGGTGGSSPDAGDAITMPPMDPPGADEPLPPCLRTMMVTDSAGLGTAASGAQPGDCIVLGDGTYTFPTITAKGTAANPIVIRAANVLKAVVMTGNVLVEGSEHVVVQGVHFRSAGQVIMGNCQHCRISRFRMERQENGQEIDWITVRGTSKNCRIDHNDFGPQRSVGNYVMLSGQGDQVVQYTRIDHNYFHDVTYGGGNGWELIRAGLSGWTFSKAFTVIERNLFVRGDSDPETISVKSSDNTIRYNTMRSTAGQFTLRHGNRTNVYGNYILGEGRAGSSGMRVYGGDHKIYNNYLEVSGQGLNIDAGNSTDTTGALTDHKVTYNVQVLFNTIVGNRAITIGSGKSIQPRNITVAYNLILDGGPAISVTDGSMVRSLGNVASGGTAGYGMGVMSLDARLTKTDGIYRLGEGSPVIDAGEAMFDFIKDDIDGRTRNKPDIGAMEMAAGPAKLGPLTEKDVGPLAP